MSGIKLRFSLKKKAQVEETERNVAEDQMAEEEDAQSESTDIDENEAAARAKRPSGIKLRFSLKKKPQGDETERNVEEDQMVEEENARSVNTDANEASSPQTAGAVNLSSSSQFQGQDPESMAELPKDKGKSKESKKQKRQRERAELIAAMQETVRGWEQKLHDYTIAGNAQVEELRAQLAAKDKEFDRVQLTMATHAESLQALVAAKDKEISSLHSQLVMERDSHQKVMHGAAERSNSTEGQLRSILAEQQSTNQQLRQDLSHQEAANEALQQSLAECQASTAKQPPVEQDGHLARVSEEKRRLEERVAGLREELEASEAKIVRQEIASQEAEEKIRPLQSRVKQLVDDNSGLSRAKRLLEASLIESNGERNILSRQTKALKKSAKRMEKESTAEVMKMDEMMEEYQAEVGALRVENERLEAQIMLKRNPRVAIAELDRRQKELDRRQKETDRLTIELGRVKGRLAECEAKIKKDAEEVEKGEREMNALLGVPEKANEGLLRPQFPWWRDLDFWFLVALLLFGLSLVWAFSPDSPTYAGDQMGRWDGPSMRAGGGSDWDPYLDLSRGMYGV
ncbi:hypothetical protein MMC29_002720 [Sticta canariensis]|nr:hypothetical protein [Sticta canariensis]